MRGTYLSGDGTLDTVFRCDRCGEAIRYTCDPDGPDWASGEMADTVWYDHLEDRAQRGEADCEAIRPTTVGDRGTW